MSKLSELWTRKKGRHIWCLRKRSENKASEFCLAQEVH